MKRVFTDEIKEEMLTSFELLSNRDEIFSDEMDEAKIAVYEIISGEPYVGEDEMNEEYKKILEHYIYLNDNVSYNRAMLDEVFNTVRQDDVNYGEVQAKQRSETLDYLNESLKKIAEGIKITKVNEQAIKKISVDEKGSEAGHTEWGGLFGEVTDFSDIMDKAGDGMTSPVYSKIYHDGKPDWDEIDRLMKDGATWYELLALSQLVDSYMYTDVNGDMQIKELEFEEFINHCFVQDDETIFGSKKYSFSPTAIQLMGYRQVCTEISKDENAEYLNSDDKERINDYSYKAFVSDSLLMLASEYSKDVYVKRDDNKVVKLKFIKNDGYDACEITVLNQSDNPFKENVNEKKDIYVSIYQSNCLRSYIKANSNALNSEKKDPDKVVVEAAYGKMKEIVGDATIKWARKKIKDSIRNTIIEGQYDKEKKKKAKNALEAYDYADSKLNPDFDGSDTNVFEKITGLNNSRNECINNNAKIDEKRSDLKLLLYIDAAGGSATMCQYGDEIIIHNIVINKKELTNRLAYYEHKKGIHISYDEYIDYINNISNPDLNDNSKMAGFEGFASKHFDNDTEYKAFVKERENQK